MSYDFAVLLLLAGGALFTARLLGVRSPGWYPVWLIGAGVTARILGSAVRYEVLFSYYGTGADAARYYSSGMASAQRIWAWEVMPWMPEYWALAGDRWGTAFVMRFSGIVLAIIGDSLRAEFLVFALLGFVGLAVLVVAYGRAHDPQQAYLYAALVSLWPSLWFWPSSVGKEALILMALCLTTAGYIGRQGRRNWPLLVFGVALAFVIRPHVAVLLVGVAALATVLAPSRSRSVPRLIAECLVTGGISAVAVNAAASRLGIGDVDLEGLVEFVAEVGAGTLQGGSAVALPSGPFAPFQALINVWVRPFPWEAHNATSMLASAEVLALWALVWFRRRQLLAALRAWRQDDALRFGLPLLLGYSVMIGVAFANLGIIARQRAPMLVIFLMLLAGAYSPLVAAARARLRARGERRVELSPRVAGPA